jgi:hypothetical protein
MCFGSRCLTHSELALIHQLVHVHTEQYGRLGVRKHATQSFLDQLKACDWAAKLLALQTVLYTSFVGARCLTCYCKPNT